MRMWFTPLQTFLLRIKSTLVFRVFSLITTQGKCLEKVISSIHCKAVNADLEPDNFIDK